jgi:hypothetical protein
MKKKEPKIKVLVHESLASTLSHLMLIFMDSSHVKFDLLLPLFQSAVQLITPLQTGASKRGGSVGYVQIISNDVASGADGFYKKKIVKHSLIALVVSC